MSHCFTFRDKALIDRYLCTKPHTNGHYEGCFFCNIVVEIRIYLPHLNSLCCLRFDNNLLAENECPWYTYLFQKYHQSFKIIKNISVEFLRPKTILFTVESRFSFDEMNEIRISCVYGVPWFRIFRQLSVYLTTQLGLNFLNASSCLPSKNHSLFKQWIKITACNDFLRHLSKSRKIT